MLSSLQHSLRRTTTATARIGGLRFQSSSSSSSSSSSASASASAQQAAANKTSDPTSKEVLASEAAAEADASLTRHRAEGDAVAAGIVSGAPVEVTRRPVRIYQPGQESTQSAKATSWHWRIDWDTLPGAGRWENALMGWASSADTQQGTHLKFKTKQDAINFAERQGYSWFLSEPHHAKIPPKAYADNFLYSKEKPRYYRTK